MYKVVQFTSKQLFGKYLLVTNTCIGGVMMLSGDGIQQYIERRSGKLHSYDPDRGKNMSIVGMSLAPIQHFIYKYMEVLWPKRNLASIAKKLLMDQGTVAPICITGFFFGMNLLDGESIQVAFNELKDKFLTVYIVDCAVWVPFQMFNFYYLSPKYRVLYVNLILVGYNAFLSYIKYKDTPEKHKDIP